MEIIGTQEELTAQSVVEVVVPNLQTALDFYLRLGFTIARNTPSFVTLRWRSIFLFVAENKNAPQTPRWTNVRIVVSDVDTIWNHVQKEQLTVGSPIASRSYGLRDFTVRDPAGFEIRFAQVIV
jgi:catechol 2,3-dioxygenase-like lactoylglutathione lyase family enzyme